MNNMLKIGITSRVVEAETYAEKRDAISQDWTTFIQKINGIPIYIPNSLLDIESFANELKIDALVLSGGDNVGFPPEREKTEHALINFAMKNEIPLLGVCRGMQKINQFFGGSQDKLETDEHVNNEHQIKIHDKKLLNIFGSEIINVNSFHHNIIKEKTLGQDLIPFALSNIDDTIEGFYHQKFPFFGVMWHPEREQKEFDKGMMNQLFNRKF